MAKQSAGLLMYRRTSGGLEVFLVHPGGPFWAKKDLGAWSIPKGELGADEAPLAAAKREFEEETGIAAAGSLVPLDAVKQSGGKVVHAWAFEGDCDPADVRSNTFSMEWPRGSGKLREFPEIDRAGWFTAAVARTKLLKGQVAFVDQLVKELERRAG